MAFEVSDYGYVIEVGRVVMEGSSADLVNKTDIKEFYLGLKDKGVRGHRRWKRKKLWR
jgi:branched-chain amino acid transport system ATP-binding protein